jgi:hypothetical protein
MTRVNAKHATPRRTGSFAAPRGSLGTIYASFYEPLGGLLTESRKLLTVNGSSKANEKKTQAAAMRLKELLLNRDNTSRAVLAALDKRLSLGEWKDFAAACSRVQIAADALVTNESSTGTMAKRIEKALSPQQHVLSSGESCAALLQVLQTELTKWKPLEAHLLAAESLQMLVQAAKTYHPNDRTRTPRPLDAAVPSLSEPFHETATQAIEFTQDMTEICIALVS